MTKEQLKELVELGLSTTEIARELHLGQTTIRYWLKKFGLKTQWRGSLKRYSDQQVLDTARRSIGYSDFLRKLGVNNSGGAFYHYKKRLEELDFEFQDGGPSLGGKITAAKKNKIAVKQKKRLSRSTLKKHMDLHDIPYVCANKKCCISHWLGKTILLHIHHKDEDKTNNCIDNLEYLCPNCHSQKHY